MDTRRRSRGIRSAPSDKPRIAASVSRMAQSEPPRVQSATLCRMSFSDAGEYRSMPYSRSTIGGRVPASGVSAALPNVPSYQDASIARSPASCARARSWSIVHRFCDHASSSTSLSAPLWWCSATRASAQRASPVSITCALIAARPCDRLPHCAGDRVTTRGGEGGNGASVLLVRAASSSDGNASCLALPVPAWLGRGVALLVHVPSTATAGTPP